MAHLLIAEDDELLRDALAALLEQSGHMVPHDVDLLAQYIDGRLGLQREEFI